MAFGAVRIRPVELANFVRLQLLRKAQRLSAEAKNGNERKCRTTAMKIVLRRCGRARGYDVYPNNDRRLCDRFHEWLYDLIWWDNTPGRKGVALAAECEWSTRQGAAIDDFEKLLTVKAPLKLFICRTRRHDEVRGQIAATLKEFRQHVAGEKYVICEVRQSKKWTCYLYHVKHVKRGRVADVSFRQL